MYICEGNLALATKSQLYKKASIRMTMWSSLDRTLHHRGHLMEAECGILCMNKGEKCKGCNIFHFNENDGTCELGIVSFQIVMIC